MASCESCGRDIAGVSLFECSHCGRTVCPSHRIPESHDCTHISQLSAPSTRREIETRPSKTADFERSKEASRKSRQEFRERVQEHRKRRERRTVSVERTPSTPATTHGKRHRDWKPETSSPDVNVDGTVSDEETKPFESPKTASVASSILGSVRLWARTPVRTAFRGVLLVAVFVGIYWLSTVL